MLEVVGHLHDLRSRHLAEVAKIDNALRAIALLDGSLLTATDTSGGTRRRIDASNNIEALEAAAEQTLRAHGAPMKRGPLVRELGRRGITVNAADPAKYIGTVLWRNQGRFMNVAGRGFWLRDEASQESENA